MRLLAGGWKVVAKRALADRLVLAAAFFVVLLAATLVAIIPIYADAVAQSGLRERLERSPVTKRNLEASVGVSGGEPAAPLDARVGTALGTTFGGLPVAVHRSGISGPFSARDRIVVFAFYDELDRHARLTAGRWPAAVTQTGPLEVVLSDPAARALHLGVGDALTARSRLDKAFVESVRVVGLYRVGDPAEAFWWNSPLETAGAGDGDFGPLVTTRQAFFAQRFDGSELRWRAEPALDRLELNSLPSLRRTFATLPSRLNVGRPAANQFALDTGLGQILADAAQSLHVARAGVLVPSAQLGLLAAWALLFTAGLLVERRLLATESLRLRGATAGEILTLALMEALLLAVPAAVAAPWLAALALRALNHVGPLAGIGLRLHPHVGWAAVALAFAAAAVCTAALALPALRARRVAVAATRRRLPIAGLAQRARLDLVLVALAALGYWQLRRYRTPLVETSGGLSIDPFLVAAPTVLLLAGALLSLRLIPSAARAAERLAGSGRGIVGPLGSRQLSRRPKTYARSALLLVLAIAIGVFAAAYARTWHRSQVDQARYAAGADLLVQPRQSTDAATEAGLGPSFLGLGARAALPTVADSFDLGDGDSGTLLALDAARLPDVAHVRSDFSDRPLATLLGPLRDHRARLAGLELPGRPLRLALSVQVRLSALPKRPPQDTGRFGGPRPHQPPSLFLVMADRDGVLYVYRLGVLREDGTSRRFVVELARGSGGAPPQASYPLSLVALDLDVDVSTVGSQHGTFALRDVAVGSAGGPLRPVALTPQQGWQGQTTGLRAAYRAPRTGPAQAEGGTVVVPLQTGQRGVLSGPVGSTDFFVRPGRDVLPAALPVLASTSFLRSAGASVGQTLQLSLSQTTVTVTIAGSFRHFPTLDPAVPAVIADLPTYLARSFHDGATIGVPDRWWLALEPQATSAANRLRAPPWSSIEVTSAAERERALLDDPVALGVIGALALGFVVAAAFAGLGFAVSAAVSARARTLEFAVMRALGLRTRELSGWIALEHALMVAFSVAGGTALGLAVSWLVLPYVSLGAAGAAPVPPVRVEVPWVTVLWLELGILGVLAAITAAQVRVVRRLRPAPALRQSEGAVAP